MLIDEAAGEPWEARILVNIDQFLTQISDFNAIECREVLHQNFATLNNLIECNQDLSNSNSNCDLILNGNSSVKNDIIITDESNIRSNNLPPNDNNLSDTNIEAFDFSKRKLVKGQWVDVKDTISQWLEAQVIDVKDDKVYIHYNGWGTRWDEWIEMNSPRIKPFRYYTQQTKIYNYHSPNPNYKPDADVNLQNNQQTDFFNLFDGMSKY